MYGISSSLELDGQMVFGCTALGRGEKTSPYAVLAKAVAAMTLIDVVAEENVHFYCAEDRGRGQGSERLNVNTVGRAALAPNLCLKARAETV